MLCAITYTKNSVKIKIVSKILDVFTIWSARKAKGKKVGLRREKFAKKPVICKVLRTSTGFIIFDKF